VTVSEDLASRLAQGRRLSDDEIGSLAETHDIITIGMMADDVRQRLHGTRTTFLRVADVPASPEGATSWPAGAGEVRIVGTPLSRKAAVDRVRQVAALAKGTPVSAFSLSELERLAASEAVTLRALLEELQAAGLELVADAAFDQLQDPKRSVEEVNISGLALARLTIHQLASSDTPALFRRVASLQRRVAVIRAFAPLPRAFNPAVPTTGYEDLKRVALARLIVDNIASIQVDWSLYGPKLAQVALTVGADDVDAVSPEDETGEGRRRAPLEEIRRNIRAASQEPVERNGRFEILAGPAEGPAKGPSKSGPHEHEERG
jgi:aminodeoxyfutalosine synthase